MDYVVLWFLVRFEEIGVKRVKRTVGFLVYLTLFGVLILGCSSTTKTEELKVKEVVIQVPTVNISDVLAKRDEYQQDSLRMNPEEFQGILNARSEELGFNIKMEDMERQIGSVRDTFGTELSNGVLLSGSINKEDDSVFEAWINVKDMNTLNGIPEDKTDLFETIRLIILTTNPTYSIEQANETMRELEFESTEVTTLRKRINSKQEEVYYGIQTGDAIGLMFTAGSIYH